jgi:hypothetical protein
LAYHDALAFHTLELNDHCIAWLESRHSNPSNERNWRAWLSENTRESPR